MTLHTEKLLQCMAQCIAQRDAAPERRCTWSVGADGVGTHSSLFPICSTGFWSGWAYKEWSYYASFIQRRSGCAPTFPSPAKACGKIYDSVVCNLLSRFFAAGDSQKKSFEAGGCLAKTFKACTSLLSSFSRPLTKVSCHEFVRSKLSAAQIPSKLSNHGSVYHFEICGYFRKRFLHHRPTICHHHPGITVVR